MIEVVVGGVVSIQQVERLVPDDTVAGFELEIVQPLGVRQEAFLTDDPCAPDRSEGAPAMLWSKARRAVTTDRCTEVISILVVVAELTEVAFESVADTIACDVSTDDTIIEYSCRASDKLALVGL